MSKRSGYRVVIVGGDDKTLHNRECTLVSPWDCDKKPEDPIWVRPEGYDFNVRLQIQDVLLLHPGEINAGNLVIPPPAKGRRSGANKRPGK